MSEARVRGKPAGDTASERIFNWLASRPFEEMVWVGKDYSLAQVKADVRELLSDRSSPNGDR